LDFPAWRVNWAGSQQRREDEDPMQQMKRRDFLKATVGTALKAQLIDDQQSKRHQNGMRLGGQRKWLPDREHATGH
jgi:hypothetical protein